MRPSLYPRSLGINIPAPEQINLAAHAGFSSIDLAVRDLLDAGHSPKILRRQLDDLGLKGGAFPLPVDWRSFNPTRLQADLHALPQMADAARTLGLSAASTWVLPAYSPTTRELAAHNPASSHTPPRHLDPDRILSLHFHSLAPIVKVLHSYGLRLAIEAIGVHTFRAPLGSPFIHRLNDPRLDWLLNALNESVDAKYFAAVGLLCDTFHLHASDETIEDALRHGPDAIAWVHLADLPIDFHGLRNAIDDNDRALPRPNGQIPNTTNLARLEKAGYTGPITPEPLPPCRELLGLSPLEKARQVRASLQSVWP